MRSAPARSPTCGAPTLQTGVVTWRERKAGDHQTLPLPAALVETLQTVRARQCAEALRRDEEPAVWVFLGRRGGHIVNLSKPWAWARKTAKIHPQTRMYDLRGSISSLITHTAGVAVAAAVLGHADTATTLRHYTQAQAEQRKQRIDLLANAINAALKVEG